MSISLNTFVPSSLLNVSQGSELSEQYLQQSEKQSDSSYRAEVKPLATFDRFSENHIKTLNSQMDGLFRVDGVIVAATFGDIVASSVGSGLHFGDTSEQNFAEVKFQLEKLYGDKLEVIQFSGSDSPTLRDFRNGDFFTAQDLASGWKPVQVLSDKEYEDALRIVFGYQHIEESPRTGFKAVS